jgi:putative transposase
MPRRARLALANVPMHILHRGNNRQPCFLEPFDHRHYLKLLEEASIQHGCTVHAYVLMTNHVHMLMTGATASAIGSTMKRTAEVYAMSFNRRRRRTGSLWEGRFRSSAVQSCAYLFSCYRYIETNPVRAGMVGTPAAYPWSSYRANAFGAHSFVRPHELFQGLAGRDEERRAAYRALFEAPEEPGQLAAVRAALQSGFALGDEAFCRELERLTGRRALRRQRGRKRNGVAADEPATADRKQFEMWSVPN